MLHNWRVAAAVIAAVLVVVANWGYLQDVRHDDKVKPRLTSWGIWSVTTAIGAIGAVHARQWAASALSAADAVTCAAVLITGWRHEDTRVGWLDVIAAGAGGAGVALLAASVAVPDMIPVAAAITVAAITDGIASTRTAVNAWEGHEPVAPFVWFTVSALVALAAATSLTGIIYPVYEVAACLAIGMVARAGKRRNYWRSSYSPLR